MENKKLSVSRAKFKPATIVLTLIMICFSLVALFPFWTMICMGTYKSADIYTGVKIWFGDYFIQNWNTIQTIAYPRYYLNSMIVSFSCAALTVIICSMAGFSFAKYRFRGKKALFNVVLLTLMVPVQLGLVGLVIEMKAIGWLSTLLPIIVPTAASPFGVFWMTQFTQSAIPDSVVESARIDGCNDLMVYLKIALPFMLPACMTLALLSFLSSWNAYLVPTIIITEERLYTVTLGVRKLATQYRKDNGAQILGLTFGTIPMLFVFSLFSKYLIAGLSASAVKE